MTRRRGKRQLPTPREAARSFGKRVAPILNRPFGVADGVLLFLSGALLLLVVFAAAVPRLMNYTAYAISSSSMTPTLARGDLVFAEPATIDTLSVGAIVVFRTDGGLITHRVYQVDRATDTLLTKADASVYLDPAPVEAAQLLGRAVYKIPLLGYISLFLGGEEVGA